MHPIDPIPRVADLDLVMRTPRLVLRPLEESDADAFFPHTSDPDLPREMSWSAHTTRDDTLAWLRFHVETRTAGRETVWAIVHDGVASGVIGLHDLTYQLRALRLDRGVLGYWLAAPLRGRGLMVEAGRAVLDFGFGPLGLHKVTVGCFDGNLASQRVIEKLGFRFLAVEKDFAFRDGRWRDHRNYELTASEWSRVR